MTPHPLYQTQTLLSLTDPSPCSSGLSPPSKALTDPLSTDPGHVHLTVESTPLDTLRNVPPHQGEGETSIRKHTGRKVKSYATFRRLLHIQDSPNRKEYLRGVNCASVLVWFPDGSTTRNYCRSKACVVCAVIRSARLREKYEPHVNQWGKDAQFVTLTDKNCHVDDLRSTHRERVRRFDKAWKRVKRKYPDAKCIRSTEVECKHKRPDTIHHHFHEIVNTYAASVELREAWIDLNPSCSPKAQKIVKSNKKKLVELVKYATKGIADQREGRRLPTKLLDGILVALKGLKLVSTHGFSPSDTYDEDQVFEELTTQIRPWKRIGELVFWSWCPELGEYMDYSTGELLLDHGSSTPFQTSGYA